MIYGPNARPFDESWLSSLVVPYTLTKALAQTMNHQKLPVSGSEDPEPGDEDASLAEIDLRYAPKEVAAAVLFMIDEKSDLRLPAVNKNGTTYERRPSKSEAYRALLAAGRSTLAVAIQFERLPKKPFLELIDAGMFENLSDNFRRDWRKTRLINGSPERIKVRVDQRTFAEIRDEASAFGVEFTTWCTTALIAGIASDSDARIFAGTRWPFAVRAAAAVAEFMEKYANFAREWAGSESGCWSPPSWAQEDAQQEDAEPE